MKCIICKNEIQDRDACPRCGQSQSKEPESAWHLKPGTVLKNRYTLGKSVGSGGFGITYFAWDSAMDRRVAIKEYLPGEFATRAFGQQSISIYGGAKQEQYEAGLKRYVDEAHKLAKLKKIDGLAQIYDYFEENLTGYIVMEYVPGVTLKEYIEENGGKLSYTEAITLLLPVMDALKEVHKHGIIHRDISPDNILITPDKDIKLIDFGASRYAVSTHSKSLSVILKPGYAPEEQYRSQGEQGPWSDVYAMGATLYSAITGIVPEESLERKAYDTIKAPYKVKGIKISKNISNAIQNAMMVDHEYRYQTMDELIDALVSDDSVALLIAPREKGTGLHISKKLKIALIALMASSLAVAGVFIGLSLTRDNDKVKLLASLSAEQINVPDLIGSSIDDANEILDSCSMTLQIDGKEYSDKVQADAIISQTPTAGEVALTGTMVQVLVSKGAEKYIMPDVLYQDIETVKILLEDMGFRVKVEESSGEYAPGSVISAEFDAGTLVEKDERILLIVSTGIEGLTVGEEILVPDAVGKTYEEARRAAMDIGLYIRIKSQEWSDDIPKGQIISQGKAYGEITQTGEILDVVVSKGVEQVVVPDVQYMHIDEAKKLLEENKLTIVIKRESSETVKEDHIISQNIEANKYVNKNTEMIVVVSTGAPWSEYLISLPTEVVQNEGKYEIVEKTQYRYSDKLYRGGSWTEWSTAQKTGDFAQTELRYSSRTRSEIYTWSTSSTLIGWTATGDTRVSGYTDWSEWSSWTTTKHTETTLKDVQTKTQYAYGRWLIYLTTGSTTIHFCETTAENNLSTFKSASYQGTSWSDSAGTYLGTIGQYYGPTCCYPVYYSGSTYYRRSDRNAEKWSFGGKSYYHEFKRTVYCYRTRSEIIEKQFWQWGEWGEWSSYVSGKAPSETDTLDTEQQYRYQNKEYYWGDWSSWQDETTTESDTRQVETRIVYSYRLIVE